MVYLTYGQRITICNRCPHRGPLRHPGYPLCTLDGVDTDAHVRAGSCPKDYFSTPSEPKKQRPEFTAEEQSILAEMDRQAGTDAGLGDTVHRYLESIGADKAADFFTRITGISCGCEKRRAWLNKWFPYKSTVPG